MCTDVPYKLRVALRLLLAGALAAVAAEYTLRVFDLNRKSYGEGPILALVERLRNEPISAAWLRGPDYTLSCYGPAYYLAFDWAARAGDWRNSIIPGRLVSLAAALAAAALACLAVVRQTRSIELGLLGSLIFLASPTVSYWMPYARVDMLALALALGAYIAVGPGRTSIAVAAVLIVAGSLVKPTMALSAIPILAHLAIGRRYRDAALFSLLVAVLGAVTWGAAEWMSRGFFLSAVLTGNRNPVLPWRGYAYGYAFLTSPLGTAVGITTAWLLVSEPAKTLRSLVGLGFLVSFAISVAIVCKQGSDHNYFLEPALLGTVLVAAYGAPRLVALHSRRAAAALAVLACAVALPCMREIKVRVRQPSAAPVDDARVQQRLRDEPANAGLLADGECVDLALACGHMPLINDSYLFALLVANGTLDAGGMLDAMQEGRVKWLLLDHSIENHREAVGRNAQMWPTAVIESMARHYELFAREGEVLVYRHRRFGEQVAADGRRGENKRGRDGGRN